MREKIASRTAYGVAMRRAAHQLLDRPRIMEDALAVKIVGESAREIQAHPGLYNSKMGKALRAFLVARSRFAEEQLARGVAEGVRQYVILGAGMDTSAYRGLATTAGISVFEVDHPATQKWKKEKLRQAGIAVPENLRYVAVDFEKQGMAEELRSAGFASEKKSFVSWLGVTPYLTREAAAATLNYFGRLPAGSGVVFDYAVAKSLLNRVERIAMFLLERRVALAGEPFRLYFEPEQLNEMLRSSGFSRIEQVGAAELNEKYFGDRVDKLRVVGNVGRIAVAWV